MLRLWRSTGYGPYQIGGMIKLYGSYFITSIWYGAGLTSRNITHITHITQGDMEVIFLRVLPAVTAHDPKGSVL